MHATVEIKGPSGATTIRTVMHRDPVDSNLTLLGFATQLNRYADWAQEHLGLTIKVTSIREGDPCLDGSDKAQEIRIRDMLALASHVLSIKRIK